MKRFQITLPGTARPLHGRTLEYAPYLDDRQMTIGFFAKLALITQGTTHYEIGNRETALGVNYNIPLGKLVFPVISYSTKLTFSVVASRLDFRYFKYQWVTIRHDSLTASLGLNF